MILDSDKRKEAIDRKEILEREIAERSKELKAINRELKDSFASTFIVDPFTGGNGSVDGKAIYRKSEKILNAFKALSAYIFYEFQYDKWIHQKYHTFKYRDFSQDEKIAMAKFVNEIIPIYNKHVLINNAWLPEYFPDFDWGVKGETGGSADA